MFLVLVRPHSGYNVALPIGYFSKNLEEHKLKIFQVKEGYTEASGYHDPAKRGCVWPGKDRTWEEAVVGFFLCSCREWGGGEKWPVAQPCCK